MNDSKMKTVNAAPRVIVGTARDVPLKVGAWNGRITLVVVPLDDFEVIFGLEFLATAKAVVVPHLGVVTLYDKLYPCMVPVERKGKGKALSALQVKTRLQHGQTTYLATLVLNEAKEYASVSLVVEELLKGFVDVMPLELLKSLPLRRVVDHRIELKTDASNYAIGGVLQDGHLVAFES
ncbi:hypothetical protein AMTR_s00086p00067620 [Amborella trichopoda]|uniref:Reverse transcriptase/retrotransposon-derived protein RNase H-like domain-containing protein n=1 Tax=Amborella trichopoda TaxID=13333 RepID=W1P5C6_AMBTC|nr:hypothetical protein AMTR_s00086p00067620 [Amborella trichopoda]